MSWQIGIAVNATVAVAYAAIAWAVLGGLARTGTLRTNRMGTATGLIFASCSAGHAGHLLHLIGTPGISDAVETAAARASYDVHLVLMDLTTAIVALVFLTLKANEDKAEAAGLYDDPATARRQALLVHEEVVQGLVVASYQLDDEDLDGARRTLSATLEQARSIASSPFATAETLTTPGPRS